MMAPRSPLVLATVFPPGEYLRDELSARGWTPVSFAEVIGQPVDQVNALLGGRAALTAPMARAIAAALGTSADLWLGLDNAYRLARVEPVSKETARCIVEE